MTTNIKNIINGFGHKNGRNEMKHENREKLL